MVFTISVEIPKKGERVLRSWLGEGGAKTWLQNAIDNKLRKRVDASLKEHTSLNPNRFTLEEKLVELECCALPTREERDGIPPLKKE